MKPLIFKLLTSFMVLSLLGYLTVRYDNTAALKEISLPTQGVSKQHELTQTADGQLLASWVESEGKTNTVRFALYDGAVWSPVRTVTRVNGKLAASPIVFGMDDGAFSAAWMQSVKTDIDPYAADIYWVRSSDRGQTWTEPTKPYHPQARIYDAQMSFAPMLDGKLAFAWTDSRFVNHDERKDAPVKTSRYQVMAAVLDKNGNVGNELTLDNDVCSCCRAYTAADGDQVMTVYRDHLPGEIRDISAVSWQPGKTHHQFLVHDDHWVINGCPSNGPSVDFKDGKGVIAWFSAGDGKGKFTLGFTASDKKAIQLPILVDDHAVGFGKAKLLDNGSALVAWRSLVGSGEELVVAQVTPQGNVEKRQVVYRGGFPRWPSNYLGLEAINDKAYIAWTDPVKKQVRLVEVNL